MKLRSFFSFLVASVLLLLMIGGSGWVWLVARSPLTLLRGKQSAPAAVMFVPRQAPVMVSLLVNPDRLEALRQVFAAPERRRQSRSELKQLKQNLLTRTGLDYEQDIQPWLGEEITLAVTTLDIDRQPQNGQQPGYLLVVDSRDGEQAEAFLQRFWEKQGLDMGFEQYQGVKLTWTLNVSHSQVGVATAIVGERVLFANHPKVLRNVINNVQAPDLALEHSSYYQQALASLQQGRIGFTFLNLPELANAPGAQATPAYHSLAIAVGLDRQGLLVETALVPAAKAKLATASSSLSALQYIPATSPLAAAGTGLDQLWSEISAGLSGYGLTAKLLNQSLSDLEARWELDLPQDIFAWVKGEYAVGLLPHPSSGGARPNWLFVAESTDPERVQQAIQHLDAVAQRQGLGAGPLAVEGQNISTWTQLLPTPETPPPASDLAVLQARVVGAHAGVDNYQVLATSLGAVEEALEAPEHSLSANDSFRQAIAPLPVPNDGYFYLDWPAGRILLEQQFPVLRAVEVAAQPLFSHLRSLAFSSYGTETGVRRGKIFLRTR